MKKIFTLLMICALVLVTGCGGKDEPSSEPEVKLGMITHLNATEQKVGELYNALVEKAGLKLAKYVPMFYDNLNTMQASLESGGVDQISIYSCVANYLSAANKKFEIATEVNAAGLADSFCFAVRKDDTQLKADLDKAINEMKSDGTLDKLVAEYITDADADNIPKVDIPTIDGAPTIKVGVTGDLPPLDFVTADNTAAGFNTAMLAEIAKRLNRNIELVQIESGARAAALSSNQIDVIFWAIVPASEGMPADIDKPEGVELSVPYFKDDITHLRLKK